MGNRVQIYDQAYWLKQNLALRAHIVRLQDLLNDQIYHGGIDFFDNPVPQDPEDDFLRHG